MPEIAAFFMAGLASGILSFAIAKKEWSSGNFKLVLQDSFILFNLSLLLLGLAALIEVFITPVFF